MVHPKSYTSHDRPGLWWSLSIFLGSKPGMPGSTNKHKWKLKKLQREDSLSQLEELDSIGTSCVQAVKDFTQYLIIEWAFIWGKREYFHFTVEEGCSETCLGLPSKCMEPQANPTPEPKFLAAPQRFLHHFPKAAQLLSHPTHVLSQPLHTQV